MLCGGAGIFREYRYLDSENAVFRNKVWGQALFKRLAGGLGTESPRSLFFIYYTAFFSALQGMDFFRLFGKTRTGQ
jgi:hypothetical protein